MTKPFLTGEWRKLCIANYKVDPAVIQNYIPAGTEISYRNGSCYLSLVGFLFLNTKIKGIKIPFHSEFEEINLRFYVKHFNGKEWRQGVTFIKEIVPKPMVTVIANTIYREKYETMKTAHHLEINDNEIHVGYLWKKREWNIFRITASSTSEEMKPGSEEEFITQQEWGYTRINEKKTSEYEVEHPHWRVYPVKQFEIKVDFEKLYGKEFSFLNTANPDSVMFAEGSEIKLFPGKYLSF